jgi:3'(2'), 5'-bisphosphate nucleotidase
MNAAAYLLDAIAAALRAGRAILEVYQSDFAVEAKADRSPLTLADKRSHEIIKAALSRHGIPFISEEGRNIPFGERSAWPRLWIVDPLDGTKEFVKRNGEFTVNIALVEDAIPVMGVVYAPVNQWLYFAAKEIGAYKMTAAQPGTGLDDASAAEPVDTLQALVLQSTPLPMKQSGRSVYTIVGSRSHGTPELDAFVQAKRQEKGAVEFIAAGSSLKICLVAEGTADIYPRLGPTMEWDTAAGQAVAEFAGARMVGYDDGQPLRYNRESLLNPWFVVER